MRTTLRDTARSIGDRKIVMSKEYAYIAMIRGLSMNGGRVALISPAIFPSPTTSDSIGLNNDRCGSLKYGSLQASCFDNGMSKHRTGTRREQPSSANPNRLGCRKV
jgi:hypothetical protein